MIDLSALPADALLARRTDARVDEAIGLATGAQILVVGTLIASLGGLSAARSVYVTRCEDSRPYDDPGAHRRGDARPGHRAMPIAVAQTPSTPAPVRH